MGVPASSDVDIGSQTSISVFPDVQSETSIPEINETSGETSVRVITEAPSSTPPEPSPSVSKDPAQVVTAPQDGGEDADCGCDVQVSESTSDSDDRLEGYVFIERR